ncbi:hypothetical protein CFS9_39060 [Flavobacterium sp. CFS9]|uniref:NERD domain-containing protein n=1 Tax=Flavobacterium sp. CFS9 TaxID=3143118 RepID=A0AAT9H732_9FLAO
MNHLNLETINELKNRWKEIMAIKESRRTQEEIVNELSNLIKFLKKDFFLPFLTQMTTHIDQRETSEVFKNLMSPMKQFAYLTNLFLRIQVDGQEDNFSKEEWQKITSLLNEVEMTYFADIGFYHENMTKHPDLDKISVSLQTFLIYFGNAQLSYDEQTMERLTRHCMPFDSEIKNIFGFSVSDCILFSNHIKKLINEKYTSCHYYLLNQEEWPKLTEIFIDRGVTNPKDWWDQPELTLLKNYRLLPGFIFIQDIHDISAINLPAETITNLINFLLYDENKKKGEIVYYADKNLFFDTPLIKLNNAEYLCPPFKYLIESFYNRINLKLSEIKKEKYTQFRNQILETKVEEIFRKLFGKDAIIFKSYYVDNKKSEQDILVIYKGFYLIIEIKDTLFRAPMRDPLKAFDKINTDFKKSIQKAYEQCLRVEQKFEEQKQFKFFDSRTNKHLFEVVPRRVKNYFSIIVTQFKYGNIQTNLENLLNRDTDAVYPWSVCVDDLEAFTLALIKLKKGLAKTQFINYLTHREAYNEHLLCSDELELCGFFINSPKDFEKFSILDNTFNADPKMSELFDAEYKNGLGFDNEFDMEIKRHRKVPKYQKTWKFDIVKGADFIDL